VSRARSLRLALVLVSPLALVTLAHPAHAQPAATGAPRADVPRVSLAEALRRARARNPDLLVAVEEIARARALVAEVRAGSLPTLAASLTFTQLDGPRQSEINPSVVLEPQTQINAGGTLALPLYPQRWVQWSQARENLRVTRLAAAEVRRQLAIAVAGTYLALIAQRQLLAADELAVRNTRAHVDYTQQRLDAGNGTLLDHERAAALYQSDLALAEVARFALARLQAQLGVLVGDDGPLDADGELRLPPAPPSPAAALADAGRLRADLALARERLVFASQVRRQSWADYVPFTVATFEPFYQDPPTQTVPTRGWQLVVSTGFTIFDGGLRYGLLDERRALEREARIRVEGTLRLVTADVRTAELELERARAALGSSREAARLAADALRLTVVSYHAGLSTNIEVIDAQLAALNADVSAALAENSERQAQLDLLFASGRFP
jgi:outer membrane protein TolC